MQIMSLHKISKFLSRKKHGLTLRLQWGSIPYSSLKAIFKKVIPPSHNLHCYFISVLLFLIYEYNLERQV